MHGLLQPSRPSPGAADPAEDADRAATGQIEAPRPSVRAWWRALRPLHWAKNLLVFLAPALGMQLASDLSARLGFCAPETASRVRRHLAAMGLPGDVAEALGGLSPNESISCSN